MTDKMYTRDELEAQISKAINVSSYGINTLAVAMIKADVPRSEMLAQFEAGAEDARSEIADDIADQLDKVTEFLVNG